MGRDNTLLHFWSPSMSTVSPLGQHSIPSTDHPAECTPLSPACFVGVLQGRGRRVWALGPAPCGPSTQCPVLLFTCSLSLTSLVTPVLLDPSASFSFCPCWPSGPHLRPSRLRTELQLGGIFSPDRPFRSSDFLQRFNSDCFAIITWNAALRKAELGIPGQTHQERVWQGIGIMHKAPLCHSWRTQHEPDFQAPLPFPVMSTQSLLQQPACPPCQLTLLPQN